MDTLTDAMDALAATADKLSMAAVMAQLAAESPHMLNGDMDRAAMTGLSRTIEECVRELAGAVAAIGAHARGESA